jgi:hypothetical protein
MCSECSKAAVLNRTGESGDFDVPRVVRSQSFHFGQGRHRYGEHRAAALRAQHPEAARLSAHAAASWSSLRMLHNRWEHWQVVQGARPAREIEPLSTNA